LPGEVPEQYEKWSPDRFLDAITTPMLVVHGENWQRPALL
jgi:dipeptidyl aminopeptidase/acylaminoacyl peptidase